MKDLMYFKTRLSQKINREKVRLWRFARKCETRGVSAKTVNAIRWEGWELENIEKAYPERILNENTLRQFKYAFKGWV